MVHKNCVIIFSAAANQSATFAVTDTKRYVPVVTLSTQNNVKLLDKLKSGFIRRKTWININQKQQYKQKTIFSLLNWS